jgi:hypothetical protein
MEKYLHRVVGLYPTRELAERASAEIQAAGFSPNQIRLLTPATGAGADAVSDSDDVLKDLLRDGAIGTAVGTAAGAGVSIALAAANITLFIASPVLGALYLVGWGASLGGLLGAAVGSERSKGDMSTLIKDALAAKSFVLVAHATTEAQTTLALRVVAESGVGETALPVA